MSHPTSRPDGPRADGPRPDGPRSEGPRGGALRPEGGTAPAGGQTITKKELVARIAERTAVTKVVAKDIIQLFLDEIIRELGRGNRLEFREFGVFEIKERAARKAQNPRTLEKVDVPAKRVVKFKVGRLMKERVALIARGGDFETPRAREDDDD
jgi:integration host factor subunit beta